MVAWHDAYVEDELHINDVELIAEPPPERRARQVGPLVPETAPTTSRISEADPWTDLGWAVTGEGLWTSRQIGVRPPGSIEATADHVAGYVVPTDDAVDWLVVCTTTLAGPRSRIIRHGLVETVEAAKQAVADAIRDVLAQ